MSNLFLILFIIISVIDIGMFFEKHCKIILNCDYLVSSISCYRCSSTNGSNPACEDLFQGDVVGTPSFLHTPCLTQVRGRTGFFHATYCIKLVAYTSGNFISIFDYNTKEYL